MRPLRFAVGAVVLTVSLTAAARAEERVKGADLVQPGTAVEQLYPKLIPLPLSQDEIDLFLDRSGKVVAWAREHREEWKAIDKAKDAFTALAKLEVWKAVDLTSGEFIAVVIKLKIAQELESGNLDINMLKQQYQFMRGMLDNPQIPPDAKKDLQKNLGILKSMLEGFDNYPQDNRALYRSNKGKIDAALTAIEQIDKQGADKKDADGKGEAEAKPDADGDEHSDNAGGDR